jgi:RimJ/RimL family protein N-acetyltransferase
MFRTLYPSLIPVSEELPGERVTLRRHRASHAEAQFAALEASRAHLAPWLNFPDHVQSLDDARVSMAHDEADWLLRKMLRYGIWLNASSDYAGDVTLHHVNWEMRSFEMGYWLRADAEGHGYMTEAVGLVLEYAFKDLDIHKAIIRCEARNTRSAAVAERLGFTREALLREDSLGKDGALVDWLVYGRLQRDPAPQ